jgi:hypothetical protein
VTSALLTVDHTNKSAFITDPDGRTIAAWDGMTRRGAVDKIREDGWQVAGEWSLTSPPDGYCTVVIRVDPVAQDLNDPQPERLPR